MPFSWGKKKEKKKEKMNVKSQNEAYIQGTENGKEGREKHCRTFYCSPERERKKTFSFMGLVSTVI